MNSTTRYTILFPLILPVMGLFMTGCQVDRHASREGDRELHSLVHDGLERTYRLVVPDSYDPAVAFPLVLALHGGGGNSRGMCDLKNGMKPLANPEGFLLVCPDGIERHWNDGRGIQTWRAHKEGIDDVGFLSALIVKLSEQYNIDQARIYSTGISNGGLMSYRLACEIPHTIRAIASVTASMPEGLICRPSRSVSVMILNGTDDPLVPYEGGMVSLGGRDLAVVESTADTIRFWVEQNGCEPEPSTGIEPDRDPEDEMRVRWEAYRTCKSGAQVVLYTIEGGGHTWPGSTLYLPEFIIGGVTGDINGGKVIWAFFDGLNSE
jgi:polyhydroxybutyrate depolymerase